jgi:signal transduction histidine kinase
VLDPYYRIERSRNRETGGHGLGLTIACNIVEAHGESLLLRNRTPRGLEVIVSL